MTTETMKPMPCDCSYCVRQRGYSVRQRLLHRLKHAASTFLEALRRAAGPSIAILRWEKLVQQGDQKTIITLGQQALGERSGVKLPPLYTAKEWAEWLDTPCSENAQAMATADTQTLKTNGTH